MKRIIHLVAITAIFTLGSATVSVAQLSKSEAEAFVSAHLAKDVQRVSVISFVQYKKGKLIRNGDSFEASTTVMTAKESCLFIVDGTGKEMYIPYSQIKALSYQPENSQRYSMIRIDL